MRALRRAAAVLAVLAWVASIALLAADTAVDYGAADGTVGQWGDLVAHVAAVLTVYVVVDIAARLGYRAGRGDRLAGAAVAAELGQRGASTRGRTVRVTGDVEAG